jgi:hypothetical protein
MSSPVPRSTQISSYEIRDLVAHDPRSRRTRSEISLHAVGDLVARDPRSCPTRSGVSHTIHGRVAHDPRSCPTGSEISSHTIHDPVGHDLGSRATRPAIGSHTIRDPVGHDPRSRRTRSEIVSHSVGAPGAPERPSLTWIPRGEHVEPTWTARGRQPFFSAASTRNSHVIRTPHQSPRAVHHTSRWRGHLLVHRWREMHSATNKEPTHVPREPHPIR